MIVYGVWDHGPESSTLYGLYRDRSEAEKHFAAARAEKWVGDSTHGIEEHEVLDEFPGLGAYALPKGTPDEVRYAADIARRRTRRPSASLIS